MRNLFLLFISLMFSGVLLAQKEIQDGNVQVRNVKGFHAVKASTGIAVFLSQGAEEKVAVSANEIEYRDRIRTVVENGVLKIYFDNDEWKIWKNMAAKKLRVYISIKEIRSLEATSGASIKFEEMLKGKDIKMDVSSGATIKGAISCASLKVDQSSGSVIELSGTIADNISVDASSGSVFKGYGLSVAYCNVDTSSGGGVQITVSKELSVDASSGGYVHYKGEGVIRNVHTSSGGSVSRKS